MKYNDVIDRLQNLTMTKVNTTEIAEVLNVPVRTLYTRSYRNSEVSAGEMKKLEAFYKVNLFKTDTDIKNKIIADIIRNGDIVKISYWPGLPDELKIPDFTCVPVERNVIKNHWGLNPESLCIIPMVGDSLTNYWYPIRNGDILIIDTKVENIMGNGVYFGTSRNNSCLWIREMCIDINLNVEFRSYSPSGEEKKVYTLKELEEVDFKLIGKVVKNVSFRL